MYPRLFTIGPITVYSFGLMLGIGFLAASWILARELKRKGLDPNLSSNIILLAIVFGIAGSKLLFLIENWESFIRSPVSMTFSTGGLTWYGGFILATFAIMIYVRRKNIPFLKICDASAPALMLSYGIARIGCHLAGDGDYGFPTDLPWACVYSNGTDPPSMALRDFPEIVSKYGINGVVPDATPVHPAPLYEFISGVLLFLVLWHLRTRFSTDGKLFMVYLILSGIARILVEFIRINPRIVFGLTEAQVIGVGIVFAGSAGLLLLARKNTASPRVGQ